MRNAGGFTLIELLITLSVAGILVALAGPSFKITIQNNRLVTQGNDFLGALIYARSEAIELNSTVTVCASSDGATCSGTNWASGWVVGYAPSGGSNPVATVLRSHIAITGGNTLSSSLGASAAFLSTGMLNGTSTGTFTLCDSRGKTYGRSLYLMLSGQAKLSPTAGLQVGNAAIASC
ncbi:MAG TPA: GspH/FimT family pseudopilin [Gammaproteobacteria bacterium]|nr:GspH/FimT family pseudopilin [Gammaproteobacteria bacterium]